MGINQASFSGDNVLSPDNGHQYGPFNLGTAVKLLHVTADLAIGIPGSSIAPGALLSFGLVWGFQWVPHGNSPFTLPADAFEPAFLWAEMAAKDFNSPFVWAPSTDTAEGLGFNSIRREWRGQLPINQDIDLYLTTGNLFGTGSFAGTMLMRVTNST